MLWIFARCSDDLGKAQTDWCTLLRWPSRSSGVQFNSVECSPVFWYQTTQICAQIFVLCIFVHIFAPIFVEKHKYLHKYLFGQILVQIFVINSKFRKNTNICDNLDISVQIFVIDHKYLHKYAYFSHICENICANICVNICANI